MTRPTCINLRERFGRRYRVRYEESYTAQYGPRGRTEDPWLMILLCRYGHVYPFGGTTLAASVDGHPNIAGLLRRLPCCRVWQDGDFGELTVTFDLADFPQVAGIMRPRRRRQVTLTPEQREQIGRRLREGREVAAPAIVQGEPTAQRRDFRAPADFGSRQPADGPVPALECP